MGRKLILFLLVILPSRVKIPLYRFLFHWRIGYDVKIGLSYIDVQDMTLGDNVRIGHFNRFQRIPSLTICNKVFIGNRNTFVTGLKEHVDAIAESQPFLYIGEDSYIIGPHFFDVHAPLRIGSSVTLAGRSSSFYTHGLDYNRACLAAKPISIGDNSYVGAHVLFVPGADVAPNTVIAMGALVTKSFHEQYVLIGGSPAKIVRTLNAQAAWFTRDRPGHRMDQK